MEEDMRHLSCKSCSARAMGLFCNLPDGEQAACSDHKTTNLYKTGQVLFYEGNRPYGAHCVFSGKIKLYKTGHGGRLQIVRLVKAGDLLGYRSLLADEPYAATAEVIEDATVCFIEKTTFFSLLRENRDLGMAMIKKLSKELRSAEDRILDVAQKPAKERLAGLLLSLIETYGKKTDGGMEIGIELSREEMAEIIGTTQETIIRMLSDLKTRGVIQMAGRVITIPDTKPLRRMAHLDV